MPAQPLKLKPPTEGHKIVIADGRLKVPDDPILPIIEGDGIGPDVTRAARRAISAAVEHASGGGRPLVGCDVPAGGSGPVQDGGLLPAADVGRLWGRLGALQGPRARPR